MADGQAPQVKAVPKTGRKGVRRFDDLNEHQKAVLATPQGFTRFLLGIPTYEEQEGVLGALGPNNSKCVFLCGNEVGKTSIIVTGTVLWHLTVFPKGTAISTAGAWRQVTDQLVPNLKRHAHKFPSSWEFLATEVKVNGVARYSGFSTTNEARSQGYHGSPEEPLLAIIDEAAAVPDGVFFSFEDRCNPQRLLITGSPLDPEGQFYKVTKELARFYRQGRLSQPMCPHIDRDVIFRAIQKYDPSALEGVDLDKLRLPYAQCARLWSVVESRCRHPLVLSRVFAAFSESVEGAILTLREYERCIENPPPAVAGDRHVFLDFAAGGDKNVIAVRLGNRVRIHKKWREKDTMKAVGEIVAELHKLKREIGLMPEEVDGDADGLGKPMVDRIREVGWLINEFHGGGTARDAQYYNAISEVWGEGTARIKAADIIIEHDEDLKAQLITRKTEWHSGGKLKVESKKDYKLRGFESPDEADAVLGAMLPSRLARSLNLTESVKSVLPAKSDPWAALGEQAQPDASFGVDESVLESMGWGAGG